MNLPLHPSLPPKPSTSFQTTTEHSQPVSSISTNSDHSMKSLCATCHLQPPKYNCPGCSTRTCSLSCSASHKSSTGCTGQRNKAAYVPMNKYTLGTMVNDYVFLEEMGRKMSGWGREIVQGGYWNNGDGSFSKGRGNSQGRGKGRGNGGRGGHSKRDNLKLQLELRDIEVDMLSLGMERRKLNQSTWDFKKQTAYLTIEFVFHKPKDPFAPSCQPHDQPFTLLTHRNDIRKSLISLIRERIQETEAKSKKDQSCPVWVKKLVYFDEDDPDTFTHPQCVMATRLDPITSHSLSVPSREAYYSFDSTQPLETLLRHTQFVEFPSIGVWDDFEGTIVDVQGVVKQEEQRPSKRRKMNPKAGKKAIQGLLDGYGSSEEEKEDIQNVLATLGEYVDSDNDEPASGDKKSDASYDTQSDDGADLDADIDPNILLEVIRSIQKDCVALSEDDIVDWGDGDQDEDDV